MPRDYYEILGVPRSAATDEIKKAYRRLAKQYHPDVNKGDKQKEEKFKEISQAYDILGDPEKKKKYDQFGHWAEQGGFDPRQAHKTWGGPGGGGFNFEDFQQQGGVDFGDLFGSIFDMGGVGRRGARGGFRHQQAPGQDLQASIEITFEESVKGTERSIQLSRNHSRQRLDVKIPAGIKDGGKIRLGGKGENGGDLYIKVHVLPHADFWREDDDLYTETPISITEAALGAEIRVPTLDGAVNLKIPPETSSGKKFRIREKGVPHLGKTGRGDLYVLVKLVVPPNLTEESKELLKKIGQKNPYNPRE